MKGKISAENFHIRYLFSYYFFGPNVQFVFYDLTKFVLKNLRRLFDKYDVVGTEHDALVKSTTKIFSNFVAFSENPNFNYV
jgi:hypothetical protein